jgi:hypothetical protein
MHRDPDSPRFGSVVIVGGGCYGSFYAAQLAQARERGKVAYREVLIVDRDPACRVAGELARLPDQRLVVSDWSAFFDRWLDPAARGPDDLIVPSPLMPHLMYEWLLRRARARWPGREVATRALARPLGTPYDTLAPDGTRYVSFADWICPTHCIEPATCPVTRGPRTWEIADALYAMVRRSRRDEPIRGPVLLRCTHQVHGVGAFPAAEVLGADREVAAVGEGGESVDVLVATVSGCHGAVNLLHLGAGTG